MDWLHWLELAAGAGCTALGLYKARKASRQEDTTAELVAGVAAEAMVDIMISRADDIAAKLGRPAAGGALLERLSKEREAAIAAGKAHALEQYRATRRPPPAR